MLQSAYSVVQIYLGCKRFDDANTYAAWARRDAVTVLGERAPPSRCAPTYSQLPPCSSAAACAPPKSWPSLSSLYQTTNKRGSKSVAPLDTLRTRWHAPAGFSVAAHPATRKRTCAARYETLKQQQLSVTHPCQRSKRRSILAECVIEVNSVPTNDSVAPHGRLP